MNFSKISPKTGLGKILRAPLQLVPKDAVMPVLQGPLKGAKWIVGSSIHGCWLGMYEQSKQQLFAELVDGGQVVYDCGAHAGFYTLLASRLVGKTGRVYAFEPNPSNFDNISKHLELNNCQNAAVLKLAVSDHDGTGFFDDNTDSSMGHLSSTGSYQVDIVRLDTAIKNIGLRPPDLIKMDIEGAEADALIGAEELLHIHKPKILLATHGRDVHKKCCEFLSALGYVLRPLEGTDIDATDELLAEQLAWR